MEPEGEDDSYHFWEGVGVIRTYGMAVRFHAELEKGEEGGSVITSRGSVADISIDMDTKGVHDGSHWPPAGCKVEDEMKIVPGMKLPPSLITGVFPLQVPQGAEYKLMDFSLRTAWGGHFDGSTPSAYGKVKLQISGSGVAVYDSSGVFWGKHDTSESTRTKIISVAKLEKIPYRILTNEDFNGTRTIKVIFTWDEDLAGGTPAEPDENGEGSEGDEGEPEGDAIAEIRLVPYETGRRILGPKHVPGLSEYRYRLELAPGESLDAGTEVIWEVTTEDSQEELAHVSGHEGLEANVEYKNTSPAWIELKATFRINAQEHSAEERIALVQVLVGPARSDSTPEGEGYLIAGNQCLGGVPAPGHNDPLLMVHEPGYDLMAFMTSVVPQPLVAHLTMKTGPDQGWAIDIKASITLKAPDPRHQNDTPAHDHIEVGYIQRVSLNRIDPDPDKTCRAYYRTTTSPFGFRRNVYPAEVTYNNGNGHYGSLDWLTDPDQYAGEHWPWYHRPIHGSGTNPVFVDDLKMNDSPSGLFPLWYNQLDAADPNHESPVAFMQKFLFFKVQVAARTTDTELDAHTKTFAATYERPWHLALVFYHDPTDDTELLERKPVVVVDRAGIDGVWMRPLDGAPEAIEAVHYVPASVAGNYYYESQAHLPEPQE